MNYQELLVAAGVVVLVFLCMGFLLMWTVKKRIDAEERVRELEEAYPERHADIMQRQIELAHLRALREKIQETELLTRLSLEMGYPINGDDTLPVVE